MIEDANPESTPPRDLILEAFTDFDSQTYGRVSQPATGLSLGTGSLREAYDAIHRELKQTED